MAGLAVHCSQNHFSLTASKPTPPTLACTSSTPFDLTTWSSTSMPPPPPSPPSACTSARSLLSSCAPSSPHAPISTPLSVSPSLPVAQYDGGDVPHLSQPPSPYGASTSTTASTQHTSPTLSGSPSSPSSANANANADLSTAQKRPSLNLNLALAPGTAFVPARASAAAVGANSINGYDASGAMVAVHSTPEAEVAGGQQQQQQRQQQQQQHLQHQTIQQQQHVQNQQTSHAQQGTLQHAALTSSSPLIYKPFPCPKCNRSYRQANGLKYHLTHGRCDVAPPMDLEHVKDLRGAARQGAGQMRRANTGSNVPTDENNHWTTSMAANPHPRALSVSSSSSASPTAFHQAPTMPHDGAEAPWIPGQSMPHRKQLQLVRGAAFNQYKFVPPPPSAEYLAMELSDNPLSLTNMTPVSIEEYYLQGQPNAGVLTSDNDPNIDGGNDRSLSAHLSPGGSSTSSSLSSSSPLISSSTTSASPPSSTMPQHAAYPYSTPPHLQDPHSRSPTGTQADDKGANTYGSSPPKVTFSPKIVQMPMRYRSSSPLRESASANVTATAPMASISSSPRASLTNLDISNERGYDKEKDMHVYSDDLHTLPMGSGANARSATGPSSRLTASPPPHAHATSPGAHDARRPSRVRRGYWNQRGDHLTPGRYIVYAPPDRAFPAELAAYPPEEVGYRNHDGALCRWAERPELPESLPRRGRAPERPYDDFVVYVDRAPMESLAPPGSRRSSIDSLPNDLLSEHTAERHSREHAPTTVLSSSDSNFMRKDEAGFLSKAVPSPSRVDPWDLDARLAVLSLRRPKSPTSSSSSYGSPQSVRSRASSWSCSPGGHIPGTSRDVLEFPFGYPTTPN